MQRSGWTAGQLMNVFLACLALVNAVRCAARHAAPPVELEIYYETLCPDTVDFFVNQLHPTLLKIGSTGILNVSLFPYGIATERFEGHRYTFSCQHGARECRGNTIQACAIHLLALLDSAMPLKFVYCMQASWDPSSAGPACAKTMGLSFDRIGECAAGSLGNELQHSIAVRTSALRPALNWVPWIVLNEVHTDDIQRKGSTNLQKLICTAYQGVKPAEC